MIAFPESHRDLLDAQVGTLATIRADGYPHATQVWFLYADGELKLSLNASRRKARHLLERPQCSLVIPDPANADRYVEIRGRARVEPDDGYAFATRLAAKYGDVDLRMFDGPDGSRVVVTIEPVNVYAVDVSAMLAQDAPPLRY